MTESIHALALAVLAFSALLVLVRAARGPTVFDRALSFETLSLIVVALLLLDTDLNTDAALGLALFAFVGTVILGYYLGKGEFPNE